MSLLARRGHQLAETPFLTVVTAVQRREGQVSANSDFRKGSESEPAGY